MIIDPSDVDSLRVFVKDAIMKSRKGKDPQELIDTLVHYIITESVPNRAYTDDAKKSNMRSWGKKFS